MRFFAICVCIATLFTGQANAKTKPELHAGSHGPRVAALQWLLSGHRPNVYNKVQPTLKHYTKGIFGKADSRTAQAVFAYKYRIGYPMAYNSKKNPVAGPLLFDLLLGHKHRPLKWVALAQQRIKLIEPGVSPLAAKIKAYELSQVGVHETSTNRGPQVDFYANYIGVALGQEWCAIFQQASFKHSGYAPPFANKSLYVPYIEQWAQARGYLNAKAKVGSLVAFLDDGGHIGYVIKLVGSSGYETVEGNSGNAVRTVYHPWNDRLRVFIDLPHVA